MSRDINDKLFSYFLTLSAIILGLNVNRVYKAYTLYNIEPIVFITSSSFLAVVISLLVLVVLIYDYVRLYNRLNISGGYLINKRLFIMIMLYTISGISVGFIPFFVFRSALVVIMLLKFGNIQLLKIISNLFNLRFIELQNYDSLLLFLLSVDLLLIVIFLLPLGISFLFIYEKKGINLYIITSIMLAIIFIFIQYYGSILSNILANASSAYLFLTSLYHS